MVVLPFSSTFFRIIPRARCNLHFDRSLTAPEDTGNFATGTVLKIEHLDNHQVRIRQGFCRLGDSGQLLLFLALLVRLVGRAFLDACILNEDEL